MAACRKEFCLLALIVSLTSEGTKRYYQHPNPLVDMSVVMISVKARNSTMSEFKHILFPISRKVFTKIASGQPSTSRL